MILKEVKNFVKQFLEEIKDKKIYLISHFDTDGITSATIFSKTLERLDKQFSVKILKQLTKKEVDSLPQDKVIIFIDLGSSHLQELSELPNKVFVIDHHEIPKKVKEIPKNIQIINTHLLKKYENLCSSELAYLVSKEISKA